MRCTDLFLSLASLLRGGTGELETLALPPTHPRLSHLAAIGADRRNPVQAVRRAMAGNFVRFRHFLLGSRRSSQLSCSLRLRRCGWRWRVDEKATRCPCDGRRRARGVRHTKEEARPHRDVHGGSPMRAASSRRGGGPSHWGGRRRVGEKEAWRTTAVSIENFYNAWLYLSTRWI